MATSKPVQKTWGFQPPTTRQKQLADQIKAEEKAPTKRITHEHWAAFDRLLWLYQDRFPWYGAAYTGTRRTLSYAIPTAAMGWKEGEAVLIVNPDFLFSLPFLGQCFVLHHELEHLIRSHCQVMADWPEKQNMLNFVMDAIINTSLVETGDFKHNDIPKGLVTYEMFKDVCANQPTDPKLRGTKFPANVTSGDFAHNWVAEELLQYLPKGNDNDNIGGISTIQEVMEKLHGALGEIFDDSSVPEEMKESIIENLLDEAEKSAGQAPGHLQKYLDAINDKTNRNWRMLVRGIGNSSRIRLDRSWFHMNRKKPWIAPGRFVFTEPRGMVMVDVSGSIGKTEMEAFIRELNTISEQLQIDMGFIDTTWDPDNMPGQLIEDVRQGKAWKQVQYTGGGTYFGQFFEYMKKHRRKYDFCLILTDGFTGDSPMVPGPLTRLNFAVMTPNHNPKWVDEARAAGFKVAIIDDSIRQEQERKRALGGQQ